MDGNCGGWGLGPYKLLPVPPHLGFICAIFSEEALHKCRHRGNSYTTVLHNPATARSYRVNGEPAGLNLESQGICENPALISVAWRPLKSSQSLSPPFRGLKPIKRRQKFGTYCKAIGGANLRRNLKSFNFLKLA